MSTASSKARQLGMFKRHFDLVKRQMAMAALDSIAEREAGDFSDFASPSESFLKTEKTSLDRLHLLYGSHDADASKILNGAADLHRAMVSSMPGYGDVEKDLVMFKDKIRSDYFRGEISDFDDVAGFTASDARFIGQPTDPSRRRLAVWCAGFAAVLTVAAVAQYATDEICAPEVEVEAMRDTAQGFVEGFSENHEVNAAFTAVANGIIDFATPPADVEQCVGVVRAANQFYRATTHTAFWTLFMSYPITYLTKAVWESEWLPQSIRSSSPQTDLRIGAPEDVRKDVDAMRVAISYDYVRSEMYSFATSIDAEANIGDTDDLNAAAAASIEAPLGATFPLLSLHIGKNTGAGQEILSSVLPVIHEGLIALDFDADEFEEPLKVLYEALEADYMEAVKTGDPLKRGHLAAAYNELFPSSGKVDGAYRVEGPFFRNVVTFALAVAMWSAFCCAYVSLAIFLHEQSWQACRPSTGFGIMRDWGYGLTDATSGIASYFMEVSTWRLSMRAGLYWLTKPATCDRNMAAMDIPYRLMTYGAITFGVLGTWATRKASNSARSIARALLPTREEAELRAREVPTAIKPFGDSARDVAIRSTIAKKEAAYAKCAVCAKNAARRCSACHTASYCSVACQMHGWRSGHAVRCT